MVSSGGELVANGGSGPAYIRPTIRRKFRWLDGDRWRHAPTKVQVTKAAPMLRQNQKRERAAAVFFPCRLVQNVQVHVLLGHQLVVWLIVRGEPTNQPNCRDRQGGSQSDLSNQLHIGRLVEKQY